VVVALRAALGRAGFDASGKCHIRGPISLGRVPLTGAPTIERRWVEADIAVYSEGQLVAVIESETDLAWVRQNGEPMPGSSGASGYTMSSIALDSNGEPFPSYAPLERMAYIVKWKGDVPTTAAHLASIRTEDPAIHNPSKLPLFLVSERTDRKSALLEPRMRSLCVTYIECGVARPAT